MSFGKEQPFAACLSDVFNHRPRTLLPQRVDMFIRQTWRETRLQLPEDIFEEGDDHVTLPPEFFDNLWHPDPYFLNSKVTGSNPVTAPDFDPGYDLAFKSSAKLDLDQIAELTHKFSSVTLYRNQTVRYAARMHAIIACQMEFQLYPMDIQSCPIYIESFSYSNQKVRFRWSEAGVTINPELKLLQYHIGQPLRLEETNGYMIDKDGSGFPNEIRQESSRREHCSFQKAGKALATAWGCWCLWEAMSAIPYVGNYSRLVVYFRFERQIGHHLIQTFAPSSLVVMLSWFSFWLDLDAIPGRVTLLVTCMLTLVTMFTGLRADIPPVAYVKALDLWMAGCMMFVFAALGEFVVVKVLDKQYQLNKNKAQESMPRIIPVRFNGEKGTCGTVAAWEGGSVRCRKVDITSPTSPAAATPAVHPAPANPLPAAHATHLVGLERRQSILQVAWLDADTGQERVLWREIDKLSRMIFPALFLLFVTMYWPVLLLKTKTAS
ncbi:Glycine receptor subunit alpha-2 [Eumeta japonica]|uniref:Glycine receptor subunit alpha-2 n=1 Tax=Eumeta variegata TaxID=151549 RepID=A0A4C1VNE3_EUMVA|nr:Glycine receptor subunit alpha-2 [Eumeta japonica]